MINPVAKHSPQLCQPPREGEHLNSPVLPAQGLKCGARCLVLLNCKALEIQAGMSGTAKVLGALLKAGKDSSDSMQLAKIKQEEYEICHEYWTGTCDFFFFFFFF